jgi:hypothetical protein
MDFSVDVAALFAPLADQAQRSRAILLLSQIRDEYHSTAVLLVNNRCMHQQWTDFITTLHHLNKSPDSLLQCMESHFQSQKRVRADIEITRHQGGFFQLGGLSQGFHQAFASTQSGIPHGSRGGAVAHSAGLDGGAWHGSGGVFKPRAGSRPWPHGGTRGLRTDIGLSRVGPHAPLDPQRSGSGGGPQTPLLSYAQFLKKDQPAEEPKMPSSADTAFQLLADRPSRSSCPVMAVAMGPGDNGAGGDTAARLQRLCTIRAEETPGAGGSRDKETIASQGQGIASHGHRTETAYEVSLPDADLADATTARRSTAGANGRLFHLCAHVHPCDCKALPAGRPDEPGPGKQRTPAGPAGGNTASVRAAVAAEGGGHGGSVDTGIRRGGSGGGHGGSIAHGAMPVDCEKRRRMWEEYRAWQEHLEWQSSAGFRAPAGRAVGGGGGGGPDGDAAAGGGGDGSGEAWRCRLAGGVEL